MTSIANSDGTATAADLPLCPFTGWQHGRVDTSAVAHSASLARRCCGASGWADTSAARTPDTTIFAAAHEVRMSPDYRSAFVSVADRCYGVSSVGRVGRSSASFITAVYLTPAHVPRLSPQAAAAGTQAPPLLPQGSAELVAAASANAESCGDAATAFIASLRAGAPYHEAAGGVLIGITCTTFVCVSRTTRKSTPLPDHALAVLGAAAGGGSLQRAWDALAEPDTADRIAIDFATMKEACLLQATAAASGTTSGQGTEGAEGVPTHAMAAFVARFGLRPADFDFNRHVNMNMYPAFATDTLKRAVRAFLSCEHTAPPPTAVFTVAPTSDGAAAEGTVQPSERHIAVVHLGELLGRAGYESVVSPNPTRRQEPSEKRPRSGPADITSDDTYSNRQATSPKDPYAHATTLPGMVSIEEAACRSRVEYLREIPHPDATIEVALVVPAQEVASVAGAALGPCGGFPSVGEAPVRVQYVIRCLPPRPPSPPAGSPVPDGSGRGETQALPSEPFVAAIGELVLRPPTALSIIH